MVFRKPESETEPKKPRNTTKTRKPNSKSNVSNMLDAIQNGKWIAPVGSELLIVKKVNNKFQRSFCEVKDVSNELVNTWDITFERWFSFKVDEVLSTDIVIKIQTMPKQSE